MLKGVPCFVRHTVVENDACLQGVPKVPREVHLSAKGMVVENVVSSMVVGYAQKACMEVQISALPMVAERGVLFQAVPRAHGVELIAVSSTEVENVASL